VGPCVKPNLAKKKECFQPPKITGLSCPTKTAKLQEVCFQRAKRTENETWDKKPHKKKWANRKKGDFMISSTRIVVFTLPIQQHRLKFLQKIDSMEHATSVPRGRMWFFFK
jgi:hypothetical protein